jgi:3-oxoacyl-[acyl-carrier-protein] synthase-3
VPGSRLVSLGSSQPAHVIPASELGRPFGRDGDWITRRTGIVELRRTRSADEALEHARRAATTALHAARMSPEDIDLLLVATCSLGDRVSTSARLAPAVAPQAAAMDINAACSGFSYALDTADSLIRTGSARRVLIVGVEWMSAMLDPDDLGSSIIFGDGAGAAVVLGAQEPNDIGIWPAETGSDGTGAQLIHAEPAGTGFCLRMSGSEVFRWAVSIVPDLIRGACARAGITTRDIEVLALHQANLRMIDAISAQLDLDSGIHVLTDIVGSGNTSAASIPIALSKLCAENTPTGAIALLAGFGAGLTFSAQAVRLPGNPPPG